MGGGGDLVTSTLWKEHLATVQKQVGEIKGGCTKTS